MKSMRSKRSQTRIGGALVVACLFLFFLLEFTGGDEPGSGVSSSPSFTQPPAPETGGADEAQHGGTGGTEREEPMPPSRVQCTSEVELRRGVTLVGNRPVGTYLCDYFPDSPRSEGGCTLSCPGHGKGLRCRIYGKGSPEQLKTADIVVNHFGPVPKQHRPEQMTLFYLGESNASEPKRSLAKYQAQYTHVVSFHHTRPRYFTWTHRHEKDFAAIAAAHDVPKRGKGAPVLDAIAVFVSRCGRGGRDGLIRRLMNAYPVHSFGGCLRTHRVEELHKECANRADRYSEKLCVFAKYRFALTLDNTREEDYVTEKVYHALVSGPIPLYDGAPNIDDFIPTPNAVIKLAQFVKPAGQEENGVAAATKREIQGKNGGKKAGDPKTMQDFRADPSLLDVERLVQHLKAVAAEGSTNAHVAWRSAPDTWSSTFRANLKHPEPTCDLCAEALDRRCAAATSR